MTTIDCTPTWEKLLPALLDLYKQHCKAKLEKGTKIREDIEKEFMKMAKAADEYNRLIKQ